MKSHSSLISFGIKLYLLSFCMCQLATSRLCLMKMTIADAEAVCQIYSNEQVRAHFTIETLHMPSHKINFVKRIIESCNYIWTIRLLVNPAIIIGDCAFHHLDVENHSIEMGGTLLPEYWGKGFMAEAFSALTQFAAARLNLKYIIGKTSAANQQAIRCLQKSGFTITNITEQEVYLRKLVSG